MIFPLEYPLLLGEGGKMSNPQNQTEPQGPPRPSQYMVLHAGKTKEYG
jgi:hypothetical protein